eukprot:PITA_25553
MKAEKKVTIKEEAASTSQVLRTIEEMKKAFQNLNLGKPEPQPIEPPFHQNYVTQESDDEGEGVGEENHFFTPDDLPTYITEEEELIGNSYTPQDEHYILSNDVVLQDESEDYQRGYLHTLSANQGQQRQLRNRTIPINPIQKRAENLAKNGAVVPQRKGKEIMDPSSTQSVPAQKMDQPSNVPKDRAEKRDNLAKEGLIPLEERFDQDDVARKPTLMPTDEGVEDVNLGTAENPKMVKLSKALPPKVKHQYIRLLSSFSNVFAWDYSDLRTYDTSIIQHTIPIKPNQNPFRQKLRRINPKLLPLIEKEVNRLYKSGIIVPIQFFDWISNLVPVRKKTGEIRLCIDFRNLNKVSLKDNYLLPKMDHILQRVVGASRMSLLDGYSGYNQILVHEGDCDKTTFTTPWGTFHYAKMPFGLKKAGATF